jgi:hypothetical protein
MCDFKVGDEVVCVDDSTPSHGVYYWNPVVVGTVYRVAWVGLRPDFVGDTVIGLAGHPNRHWLSGYDYGYFPHRFRKVQRRDLSAWLETSTDVEEPKRAPKQVPA